MLLSLLPCLLLFKVVEQRVRSKTSQSTAGRVLLAVLTTNRCESLSRLLDSLANAVYAGAVVDISLHVDVDVETGIDLETLRIVKQFQWPHGEKTVVAEREHIGLRKSWLSVSPQKVHEYVAILEDDLELSPYFFLFFRSVSVKLFKEIRTTAFCLHPHDWELHVWRDRKCRHRERPRLQLYLSPEPCNWGPVWVREAWINFTDWVRDMETRNELPYVPRDVGFNYNKYLDLKYDVQSPWVWRFQLEHNYVHARYTLTCQSGQMPDIHMAVNHRERGSHFQEDAPLEYHLYLHSLLVDTQSKFASITEDLDLSMTEPVNANSYQKLETKLREP